MAAVLATMVVAAVMMPVRAMTVVMVPAVVAMMATMTVVATMRVMAMVTMVGMVAAMMVVAVPPVLGGGGAREQNKGCGGCECGFQHESLLSGIQGDQWFGSYGMEM